MNIITIEIILKNGLKTMKFIRIIIVISIIYIIISLLIMKYSKNTIYVYHEPNSLKITYGESKYFTITDQLKVSLEKVTREKYFIVYSQITGNQSYFGLALILEDLAKKAINKMGFEYIYIEDVKTKKKYYPIPYYEIENIPIDNPFKWKAKFYAKFLPLPYQTEFINIYFKFDNKIFKLQNVDIR